MNPRAIALQGIGFAALFVAVQGITPVQIAADVPFAVAAPSSGAGVYYDTGRAVVKKDHGWVKATKYGVVGGMPFDMSVLQTAMARGVTGITYAKPFAIQVASISDTYGTVAKTDGVAYTCKYVASFDTVIEQATLSANTRPIGVEWLSADELVVILETMA